MIHSCLKLFLLLQALATVTCDVIPCNSSEILPFHCADGLTCIDRKKDFCSIATECPDGSDEYTFNSSMEAELGLECYKTNVSCHLPRRYECDHELDCTGGRDECGCVHTFQCANGDCAVKVQFCDGHPDCADGTDEVLYNRTAKVGFQCPVTRFHETNVCVLPDMYVCDGDSNCDNGIDECFCDFSSGIGVYLNDSFSNDKCFRCLDGSLVIPNKYLCDGKIHCPDLSDECLCTDEKNYTMPEICGTVCDGTDCICPGNTVCTARNDSGSIGEICLPLESICDATFDCENGLDENYCPEEDQFFMCSDNKKKIRKSLVCNGFPDCSDGSDEDHCPDIFDYYCRIYRQYLPNITDWENETQTDQINVQEDAPQTPLMPGFPFYADRCDGVPTCTGLDDECSAPGCDGPRPGYCDFVQAGFECPNSLSVIIGREICDGMPSCNDTNPELSADELYCPNRFYCTNNGSTRLPIHLPLSNQCDGIQDCDDQSDELGCSEDTHFYCNDTGSRKFIRRAEVCDGTLDCASGNVRIAECQNCNPNPFSDDEKLITSRVLIVFLWIIGLIAVIGNLAVMIHQLKSLITGDHVESPVAVSNKYLVLNLSVADILVGLYLVALGVKDATATNYCTLDAEWRSSVTCRALGTMALIGTEASVFLILLMAGYRLYLIMRPFTKLKTLVVKITIGIAWICALLLALLPHIPSLIDYFVSCVWYRDNVFFGYICHADLEEFSEELLKRSYETDRFQILRGGKTWNNMFEAMKEINSAYVPERYFGYYSAHSVCLPRLFPDIRQDNSWGYSMFLIVLNFASLVFILISYVQIYRESTRNKKMSRRKAKDRAADLQKKISRIVATDFCCWMPICIMAFIKVSGVYVPDAAYAVTAVILLPINAAINPFLYSNVIDFIWEKMMPIRKYCAKTPCGENCVQEQPEESENSTSLHNGASTSMTVAPVTTRLPSAGAQRDVKTKSDDDNLKTENDYDEVMRNEDHTYIYI